jgi:hypothetical protein
MFHLERSFSCCTWNPWSTKRRGQWQHWILAAVSCCCTWCGAWRLYSCNFTRWALITNTYCVPKFCCHSVYCFIWYVTVRISITKFLTKNSRRFRCEVMFENEHTFFFRENATVNLHSFCATDVSSGLATRVTLNWESWKRFGESLHGSFVQLLLHCCFLVRKFFWVTF